MGAGKSAWRAAVIACATMASAACSASHPHLPLSAQVTRVWQLPTTPATQDAVALYNDSPSTVYVSGCLACAASGDAVASGSWLPLNLPPNKAQLRIRQPSGTTCLMILDGVSDGNLLTVRVSESAASAC